MIKPLSVLCYHHLTNSNVPKIIKKEINKYLKAEKIIKKFLLTCFFKYKSIEIQIITSNCREQWIQSSKMKARKLYWLMNASEYTYYRTMEFLYAYVKL